MTGDKARSTIGLRLRHIRASRTQPEMAAALGVAGRTYANYERDERVPDADTLALLVQDGWNANWLLTGEGPERLEALTASQPQAQPVGDDWSSQAERIEAMKLAVELLDGELAKARKVLAPDKRAEAYLILCDLLLEPGELPSAKVVQLAIKAVA